MPFSIILNQLSELPIGGHNKRLKINTSRLLHSTIILVGFALSSCVGAVPMFPSDTPTITLTLEATKTPSPTATERPTDTPTLMPTIEPTKPEGPIATARQPLRLGRVEIIEEGGFSFQGPLGYESSFQRTQVILTSDDGDTVISLIGGRSDRLEDLEADLNNFVDRISRTSLTLVDFDSSLSYEHSVDGVPGLAAEVTGMWGESSVTGRILVAAPAEDQLFYALAISPDTSSGEGWEPQGRQAFEAIIRSIVFHEPYKSEE